jgi:hypothetical protein
VVALSLADNRGKSRLPKAKACGLQNPPKQGQDDQLMRIVHYKSVAVKLVIHAAAAKSGGFRRHADFHTLYNAAGGRSVRVGAWFVTGHSSDQSVVMWVFGPKIRAGRQG